MNKQSTAKLSMFLTGLLQRMKDKIDVFKALNAIYKSGTKEYHANLIYENGKIKLNYNGKTEFIEIDLFPEKIMKFSENYEALSVVYEERGTTIYIDADNKSVKMNVKESEVEEKVRSHLETAQITKRDYYIKVGQADELLKEIGILSSSGKVKNDMIRKYNQIDHYIEILDGLLKRLCEKNDTITVLDCGCGKSYLLFVLNYYITEVLKKKSYFIGVDYSETVIEASQRMASNLGYKNMDFKVMDIGDYSPDRRIDLVISLHACNTATDEALAVAVSNEVQAIVAVPCCQKEILSQYSYEPFSQIIKHGILKARIADVLTDGIRSLLLECKGYKVNVLEYISPLETPKNLMIIAEKANKDNKKSTEEYYKLKEILNVSPTLEKIL